MIVQKQLVVFNLGNEEFGTEIKQVEQIIRLPTITKLPNTPGDIKGIINLRGNLLPLVNLHRCLALESLKKTDSASVIVVNLENGRNMGIMVDFVSEILHLDKGAIEQFKKALFLKTRRCQNLLQSCFNLPYNGSLR